jgi:serine/threonine-protein kinase
MKKVGRYEILEELGRGATGVVYKASDPTIGRVVALKVLSLGPSTADGIPGAREIFMREARAAGKLSHPGIVTIHDALEDPETQSSCIVMEFVPGQTLEKLLAAGPRFETERTLDIARQVAEALDYAHRQNVIHRDLKPANIILAEDGHPKLMDFGIAKIMAREGAQRTVSIMGTPSYMSPEQVSGGEVDERSDLFSLGIMLYAMLTEQKPFKGDTATVMFKIAYEDPVLPSRLTPELNPAHDYLVLRCLAKNPQKRYASSREFLDDLEDVCQGRPPRGEAKVPLTDLRVGEPTLMTLAEGQESLRRGSTREIAWLSTAAGAALLFLISLLGLWMWRRQKTPLKPPAPDRAAPAATQASPPAQALPGPVSPPHKQELTTQGKKVIAEVGAKPGTKSKAAGPPSAPRAEHRATASTAPAASRPARPAGSSPLAMSRGARVVQLVCRHDLLNATLTVSSSNQVISQWSLKGKKTGGFLGIRSGHKGTLSRALSIPEGTRELSVRVVSADGSFDLSSRPIPATPPAGAPAILQIDVTGDHLTVNWQAPPARPKT